MQRDRILTYRLRGNRITEAQEAALFAHWQKYGLSNDLALNLDEIFPTYKTRIMEIGFGMGEATALIGRDFPARGFLAVEVHFPGVGKLMARIEELGLKNIRIMETDVHILFEQHLEDKCLDGIHLFFPDPWPKKKHNKRRIVNPEFLKLVAPKIKDGGFIHIATDWVPYAEVIEEVFATSDLFTGGVVPRPDWRPLTRFEGQGITKNHQVTDLRYLKK